MHNSRVCMNKHNIVHRFRFTSTRSMYFMNYQRILDRATINVMYMWPIACVSTCLSFHLSLETAGGYLTFNSGIC